MIQSQIAAFATQTLGFEDCRFTDPFLREELDEYREWITKNRVGDMGYLTRHLPMKENPALLLQGVRSAIVVIKNYKNTAQQYLEGEKKIARYAAGLDYHEVMQEKLQALSVFITEIQPEVRTYIGVDSRPIPERSLALKAGIGFRGKNTMVIRPKIGSYFLIGVMYTTLAFEPDKPFIGTCGTCTRCVDACPTQALSLDGKMEAEKCISYRTIEHKTPLPREELDAYQGWIFGCDICQEVCPFNHPKTPLTDWESFQPHSGVGFRFESDIPKASALYRSRKRLLANVGALKNTQH